jgi:transposase InsO family protein
MLDDFNRKGLGIEVEFSLSAEWVIRCLNQINAWRGKPDRVRLDNGPEYVSRKRLEWAETRHITIQHIQPASPSKMPISNVTIGLLDMNGLINTSSKQSRRHNITQHNGSGLIIMKDRTWVSVASHPYRNQKWLLRIHSKPR